MTPAATQAPELILIAALAHERVIGKDNRLLWHLPEDMKHFKTLTLGHPVIMGRKTWESLPEKFRPLPGRQNIVVTRNADYRAAGATVVRSLAEAQRISQDRTTFVIGGAELYAHALALADRLELTEIDASFPGDAFFPCLDATQWRETSRIPQCTEAGLNFAFVSYTRIRPGNA